MCMWVYKGYKNRRQLQRGTRKQNGNKNELKALQNYSVLTFSRDRLVGYNAQIKAIQLILNVLSIRFRTKSYLWKKWLARFFISSPPFPSSRDLYLLKILASDSYCMDPCSGTMKSQMKEGEWKKKLMQYLPCFLLKPRYAVKNTVAGNLK